MIIRLAGPDAAPHLTTFGTFARDNADAFDAAALADLHDRLCAGESVALGGGAAPLITVEALRGDDPADAAMPEAA